MLIPLLNHYQKNIKLKLVKEVMHFQVVKSKGIIENKKRKEKKFK